LILAKEDVLTVSRAVELALFMDVKLDVSKVLSCGAAFITGLVIAAASLFG